MVGIAQCGTDVGRDLHSGYWAGRTRPGGGHHPTPEGAQAFGDGLVDRAQAHQGHGGVGKGPEVGQYPVARWFGHPPVRELLDRGEQHGHHPLGDGDGVDPPGTRQGPVAQQLERKVIHAVAEGVDPPHSMLDHLGEVLGVGRLSEARLPPDAVAHWPVGWDRDKLHLRKPFPDVRSGEVVAHQVDEDGGGVS